MIVYEGLNKCLESYGAAKPNEFERLVDSTGQALGTVVSYTLVAGTALTEYTLKLVIGVSGTIIICSPAIIALGSGAGGDTGELTVKCLAYVGEGFAEALSPIDQATQSVFEETQSLRCPDVDLISKDIRILAKCYTSRGEKKLASLQLQSIKNNKNFYQCLSHKEKKNITQLLSKIENT